MILIKKMCALPRENLSSCEMMNLEGYQEKYVPFSFADYKVMCKIHGNQGRVYQQESRRYFGKKEKGSGTCFRRKKGETFFLKKMKRLDNFCCSKKGGHEICCLHNSTASL